MNNYQHKYIPLSKLLTEYNERNGDNNYISVAVGKYGIRKREEIYSKALTKDFTKYKVIRKNTLTIGMGSNQIDIGVLSSDEVYCVSPAYHTFKIVNVDSEYLNYCLKNKNYEMFKKYSKRGARQGKNIDYKRWMNYEIPIYDYEVQKNIACNLKRAETIIEQNKNLLVKIEELKKSIFVDMFGDPFKNPNHYDFVPFSEFMDRCVDIGSNGANKDIVEHLDMKDEEDYALLVRTLNLSSNDFVNNIKYISKESYEYFSKSKVYGGEIIFNKIGSAGVNFLMPNLNRPVSLGLNQILVTPKNIKTRYLYDFLNTDFGKFDINSRKKGAVTKSIQKTELKKIPIMNPPIELQEKYEFRISMVDSFQKEVENQIDKLENFMNSLMQEYFN